MWTLDVEQEGLNNFKDKKREFRTFKPDTEDSPDKNNNNSANVVDFTGVIVDPMVFEEEEEEEGREGNQGKMQVRGRFVFVTTCKQGKEEEQKNSSQHQPNSTKN